MALVDLKSNLANFRSTFTTPSVASQTVTNLKQPTGTHINKASDSNLDIDFSPTSYIGKTGFTKKIINTSKFNIDTVPDSYTGKTKFSDSFINTSLFDRADEFILKYTGKTGFTKKIINTSKFNIDSIPSKFSISTKYTPTNFYPDAKVPKTSARWKGLIPPSVNFFADGKSGAKGFSTKFTDVSQTKFTGATKTSYTYPNLLGLGDRLVSRPLTNSKFPNSATATLANQLPAGSVFHYTKAGVVVSKKFSTQGYSESRKYGDNVKSMKGQSDKSLLFTRSTERNSPSAIDLQYSKFSLRDEAYNPTYMKQPFVVRGIQRKGKETPQYWGFGARAGFDDGLIQGGVVTVADRVASDTVRIAKWMASPKGLLWVAKQIGLGLTNPKVEAIGGTFGRQTRIHTGVTSLLSVAGSPFGLHFTRHGIPFANSAASYENVIKTKQLPLVGNPSYSRLVDLQREFDAGKYYTNKIIEGLSKVKILKTKSFGSEILSGLAGPGSVYGIGYTQIRRVVDTKSDAVFRASKLNFVQSYNINSQYASVESKSGYKVGTDLNTNTAETIDSGNNIDRHPSLRTKLTKGIIKKGALSNAKSNKFSIKKQYASGLAKFPKPESTRNDDVDGFKTIKKLDDEYNLGIKKQYETNSISSTETIPTKLSDGATKNQPNPFKRLPDITRGSATESTIDRLDYKGPDIRNYVTLAYGKIPTSKSATVIPNDFRNDIIGDDKSSLSNIQKGFIGVKDDNYYKNNNLDDKYGFGNLGQVGADRSKPNAFAESGTKFGKGNRTIIVQTKKFDFRGDKVNALDVDLNGITSSEIYPDGTKDLIKFYFQDGAVAADAGNYAVMAFRATMTGFTDSFSPGWDRIDIMGRPDGAYLYNSFERNVSFNFTVAAMSRSEMIPMWRKLNYLASYTMPDFKGNAKPSGPFMRITIGDLFYQTPGFITSLSYTIPDDATWDIAEDVNNADAKQLPMVVEASISFTIVGDYRPQMHGRVYSLSPKGTRSKDTEGQWLGDASIGK
jgi:hypothetical protein